MLTLDIKWPSLITLFCCWISDQNQQRWSCSFYRKLFDHKIESWNPSPSPNWPNIYSLWKVDKKFGQPPPLIWTKSTRTATFFGKPSLRPSWWRPSPWWVLFCVQTFQLKSGQVWAIHRMAEMLLNKDLRSLDLATVPMMFRSSVLSNTGHFCEAGLRKCLLQTLPDHLWWGIWAVYHTWPIFILVPALVTSLCRYLTWAEHYRWVKVDRITAEWITSKILKISLFFLAPQVLL